MGEFEKVSYMLLGSWLLSIFAQQNVFRTAAQSLRDISKSKLSDKKKEQQSRSVKDARRELLLHFFLFTPALVAFVFLALPFFQAVFLGTSYAHISQNLQKYPNGMRSLYAILGGICGVLPIETIKRFVRRYVSRILTRSLKEFEQVVGALKDGDDDGIDEGSRREEEGSRREEEGRRR